jgi:hypothetical protein
MDRAKLDKIKELTSRIAAMQNDVTEVVTMLGHINEGGFLTFGISWRAAPNDPRKTIRLRSVHIDTYREMLIAELRGRERQVAELEEELRAIVSQ